MSNDETNQKMKADAIGSEPKDNIGEKQPKSDHFQPSRMGNQHRPMNRPGPTRHRNNNQVNEVDYNKLFSNIDQLMKHVNELQPIFKQISPLLKSLKKK